MKERKELVGIYSGGYPESLIVKVMLESHGIEVYQENFIMSTMHPALVSCGAYDASILKIEKNALEKAKDILQDYELEKIN